MPEINQPVNSPLNLCSRRIQSSRPLMAGLYLIAYMLLLAVSAQAQTPQPSGPEKYALLVAVAEYRHATMNEPQPLQFPVADAEAIAKIFRDSGYEVDLLTGAQATQSAIRAKLESFGRHGNQEGAAVIGLWGHGVEYASTSEAMFCPYDTGLRKAKNSDGTPAIDPNTNDAILEPDPATLIGMSELLSALKLSGAGNRLMIADCCRNSTHTPRGRAFGENVKVSDLPSNTVALFACSKGERAYESAEWGHGAFTKCLLDLMPQMAKEQSDVEAITGRLRRNVSQLVTSATRGQEKQSVHKISTGNPDLLLSGANEADDPDFKLALRYLLGDGLMVDDRKGVQLLNQAAERGNAKAAVMLGWCYFNEIGGLIKDPATAIKLYTTHYQEIRRKGEQGDAHCQAFLGDYYNQGIVVQRDLQEAIKWFERAAENGNGMALMSLGEMYASGDEVPLDADKVTKSYERLAQLYPVIGNVFLASIQQHGWQCEPNAAEAIRLYRSSALKGELSSLIDLANCLHAEGQGEADDNEAFRWLSKAVELGSYHAAIPLANCYFTGRGVPKDEVRALQILTTHAKGHVAIQLELARRIVKGEGVQQDTETARAWFNQAIKTLRKHAAAGRIEDTLALAVHLFDGVENQFSDQAAAIDLLREAAKSDDPRAVVALARALWQADTPDLPEAIRLLQQVTDRSIEAQWMLGYLALSEDDVSISEKEGVRWLIKAGEQNYPAAHWHLAEYYLSDLVDKPDPLEALRWLHVSAEYNGESCYQLGLIYSIGNGVPQDYAEANRWFARAAADAHAGGERELGASYLLGYGTDTNYVLGLKYLRRAEQHGDTGACYFLGIAHLNGYGVEANRKEASRLLKIAVSDQDNVYAGYSRSLIEQENLSTEN